MSTIHISESGGAPIHYPENRARELWAQGRISAHAHYWKEGMPEWRPATEYFGQPPGPRVPPPLPAQVPRGFAKDPTTITRVVKVLLWISLGMGVVSAVAAAVLLFSSQPPAREDELRPSDIIVGLIGLVSLLVYLATIVPFLMWIHRAHVNARHQGALDLKFTPGWSVGWFFIPILNLWKPYQAMKELWQASKDPAQWPQQSVSAIVGNWWALWLLTNVLGNLSLRLNLTAKPDLAKYAEIVDFASEIAHVGLCVVALRLIASIYQMQSEWAQRPM